MFVECMDIGEQGGQLIVRTTLPDEDGLYIAGVIDVAFQLRRVVDK